MGRRSARDGPRRLGQLAAVLDHVETDDPHARGDQQLDDELTDEAEPDDAGSVAELGLAAPDALHRDRPDGGERGVLGLDAVGYRHAEVDGTQLTSA